MRESASSAEGTARGVGPKPEIHRARSVLLVNMGGPEASEDVRPYLEAIFRDRAILPLPGLVRLPLAWWIARQRAPKVVSRYALIGGGSPLGRWTAGQAERLASALEDRGHVLPVAHAFRYTEPSIASALGQAASAGARRVLLVPLFPHYTKAMTGSVVEAATRAAERAGVSLDTVPAFGAEREVLACWQRRIDQALGEIGQAARVLFVAHGIPERSVRRGEDYPERVADTARELGSRLPTGCEWSLAFQSRVGPVRWTGPYLEEELERLCREPSPLVIVPLSFVADCLETLYDLDRVAAAEARRAGVREVRRVAAFNDDSDFADALAAIVLRALHDLRE